MAADHTSTGIPGLSNYINSDLDNAAKSLAQETVDKSIPHTSSSADHIVPQTDAVDAQPGLALTHALEALLGGLDPLEENAERAVESTLAPAREEAKVESLNAIPKELSKQDEPAIQKAEVDALNPAVSEPAASEAGPEEIPNAVSQEDLSTADNAVAEHAIPAALQTVPVSSEDVTMGDDDHPEWEADSSPIESSSDDSSDSSSDESEEGETSYKLLSPEEQARILMADGGSDDEGGSKSKGAGGQLRTKNEIPEVVIPKPDVTITPEMVIEELGLVEAVVENILLIKAKTSGEYRVLESGSVLCLEDRSVFGAVAETLGRVQQPLYSVVFTNPQEVSAAGLFVGTKVFYSQQHSTYVFTQALKAFKGSDASNLHDEEVEDEEMEFSDDEAEAEHKRRVKKKRQERNNGKMQQDSSSHSHSSQQQLNSRGGLNYDETDDGPYKPLARPAGLANTMRHSEAPQESERSITRDLNPSFRSRGRGDRDRGERLRGRGGRGRGGFQDRRVNGYPQSPHGRPSSSHQSPAGSVPNPLPNTNANNGFSPASQSPPTQNHYNMPQQYPTQHPQMPAWPQFPPQTALQQQQFQQVFQNLQNSWPNMPPAPPIPSGAFINPAFFNNNNSNNGTNNNQGSNPKQWNQQGQQGGHGHGGTQ